LFSFAETRRITAALRVDHKRYTDFTPGSVTLFMQLLSTRGAETFASLFLANGLADRLGPHASALLLGNENKGSSGDNVAFAGKD
jgi:hypothetical protein